MEAKFKTKSEIITATKTKVWLQKDAKLQEAKPDAYALPVP